MDTAWNLGDGVIGAAMAEQKAIDLAFHTQRQTRVQKHEVSGVLCTIVVVVRGWSPVIKALNRGEALRSIDCGLPCSCGPHTLDRIEMVEDEGERLPLTLEQAKILYPGRYVAALV